MIITEFTVVFFAMLNLSINLIWFENRRADAEVSHIHEMMMEVFNNVTNIGFVISMFIKYDLWLTWSKSIGKYS